MPTIVIHQLHQAPKKVVSQATRLKVGREAHCQIILPDATVSREHAVLGCDPAGRWMIRCISETNPIIVDGALITTQTMLAEGSEILVGTESLLIFSLDEFKATSYMGEKSYFSRSECSNCHWKGMISTLRRRPVCPRCGGADLVSETEYRRDTAANKAKPGQTISADPAQMKEMLQRIKAAKRSHLERIDGRDDGPTRKDLNEEQDLKLGKGDDCQMKLFGLLLGRGVTLRWDGRHFTALSEMTLPSMKVNGSSEKKVQLKNGDILEVGSNRFRFVTE